MTQFFLIPHTLNQYRPYIRSGVPVQIFKSLVYEESEKTALIRCFYSNTKLDIIQVGKWFSFWDYLYYF